MNYVARSQEDWDDLVSEGRLKYAPDIYVTGSVSVESYRLGGLDVTVSRGGEVTAPSGVANWYFLAGGRLALKWDGQGRASLAVEVSGESIVTLIDYPDDVTPVTAPSSVGAVTFVRKSSGGAVPVDVGAASVKGPAHYVWLGEALVYDGAPEATADLQSWDVLDALFPDNPHLWNAGKYLTRLGRKGDSSKRLEDLRKALSYLERAIEKEECSAQ